MIIPKGKRFQVVGVDLERSLLQGDSGTAEEKDLIEGEPFDTVVVPRDGYKGNAYLGQDVNFSVSNTYTKPLEGVLDRVPHIADIAFQAASGVSIRNNRFTSIKYWAGTEPVEMDFQFIFETQIDSYYDVFKPVFDLVSLALPGETDLGFYIPPTPNLKYIGEEIQNFNKVVQKKLTTEGDGILAQGIESGKGMLQTLVDKVTNKTFLNRGFESRLYLGNSFKLKPLIIKNIVPTFSTESAYAPFKTLFVKDNNNPISTSPPKIAEKLYYSLAPRDAQLVAQTICAFAALKNNLSNALPRQVQQIPIVGSLLKKTMKDILNQRGLEAYPMRAEVTMSVEALFPFSSNRGSSSEFSKTDLRRFMRRNSWSQRKYQYD